MSDLVKEAVAGRKESAAGWVRANCPYCEERVGKADRQASLSWKPSSGWWGCWRCDARGWLEHDGWTLQPDDPEPPQPTFDSSDFYDLTNDRSRALEKARRYLRSREIPERTWREAGLHVALQGRFADRVVIPMRWVGTPTGEWVGFAARSYSGGEPKVLYPRGMRRDIPLCDPGDLHHHTNKPLYVVEGPFDALRHWPDAAAVLGQPTDAHEALFAEVMLWRPVVVVLDGDAWQNAEAFAQRLRLRRGDTGAVGWMKLPPGRDPGGMKELNAPIEWL